MLRYRKGLKVEISSSRETEDRAERLESRRQVAELVQNLPSRYREQRTYAFELWRKAQQKDMDLRVLFAFLTQTNLWSAIPKECMRGYPIAMLSGDERR